MWTCITQYDVQLNGATFSAGIHYGVAVYREWRLPDDNGDPGVLVRRELLSLEAPKTKPGNLPGTLNYREHVLKIYHESLSRPLSWEVQDYD